MVNFPLELVPLAESVFKALSVYDASLGNGVAVTLNFPFGSPPVEQMFSFLRAFDATTGKSLKDADHFRHKQFWEEVENLRKVVLEFLAWNPSQSRSKPAAEHTQKPPTATPQPRPAPAPTPEPSKPKASWHGGARPVWENGVPSSASGAGGAKTEAPKPNPPKTEAPPASPPPPTKPPEATPTSDPTSQSKAEPPREPPPRRADGAERFTDWGRKGSKTENRSATSPEAETREKEEREQKLAAEARVYKAVIDDLTALLKTKQEVEDELDNNKKLPPAERSKYLAALEDLRKEVVACYGYEKLFDRVRDLRKKVEAHATAIRQSEEFAAEAARYPDRNDPTWEAIGARAKAAGLYAKLMIGKAKLELDKEEADLDAVVKRWEARK
ncbi:hypothetical protein KBD34_02685 [Patescibacteria group bacterium]|nr:hypothetical protein [Patescibacteria group bacterium]